MADLGNGEWLCEMCGDQHDEYAELPDEAYLECVPLPPVETPHYARHCDNCGAGLPEGKGGYESLHGRFICCPHCLFNPLGCRCKYGEYGVAETYQDPDYPEFGPYEDDEA